MKHDNSFGEPAELAALYVAGALPQDERARFEEHLSTPCAVCAAQVAALAPVAAALTAAVRALTPDPRLREALLARVAGAAPPPPQTASELFISRAAEAVWQATDVPGITMRTLFFDRERKQLTALLRVEAGRTAPAHLHPGPEEVLVLEGDLRVGELLLGPGDYQRMPAGSRHIAQTTERGCLVLISAVLNTAPP
jgi:putative transcriptional regulator